MRRPMCGGNEAVFLTPSPKAGFSAVIVTPHFLLLWKWQTRGVSCPMNINKLHALFILTASIASVRADVVFVATITDDVIARVSSAGNTSPVISAGLINPQGIVYDSAGNAYVSNTASGSNDGSILKFPAGGGAAVTMAAGVGIPTGLALDSTGNLYAALSGEDRVIKITAPATFTTFASLSTGASPRGIAFSPDGDLFVANQGINSISKITPAGSVLEFSDDVTSPVAVAFDPSGSIFAAHGGAAGAIVRFNPNGKAQNFVNGFSNPRALAIDSSGTFFLVNGDNSIKRIDSSKNVFNFATGLADPQALTTRAPLRTLVAVKGEQIAVPTGAIFSALYSPAAGGGTSYRGRLLAGVAGIGSTNAFGIWHTAAGGPRRLVAQQSGLAPDTIDAQFQTFSEPIANSDGRVAFRGVLKSGVGDATSGKTVGLWAELPTGSLALAVRQGQPPVGVAEIAKFTAFSTLAMPESNGPVFAATIAGTGITSTSNTGIWRGELANQALILRKGAVLPTVTNTPKLTSYKFNRPVPFSSGHGRGVSSDGTITVLAKLSDTRTAILSAVPGSATLIAATTDILPSAPTGGKIASLYPPSIGGDNGIAYRAKLVAGIAGVSSSNAIAIYHSTSGGLRTLVARTAFPAPGTTNAVFATLADPLTNASGEVAFRATLKGGVGDAATGTTTGIWSGPASAPTLVARQGSQAPGLRAGAKYLSFSSIALPDDLGPVILANISGPSITTANNQGIWAGDADGSLQLVAQKGATYDVNGTKKTITALKIFKVLPYVAGHSRSVEKSGAVVFLANFSDTTHGIFRVELP